MNVRKLFVFALVLICTLSFDLARSADSTDKPEDSIGYATVAQALAALRAKAGVKFRTEGGMLIADDFDGPNPAAWIFYPKSHPAYPTVIKRFILNTAEGAFMETRIKCEASQEVCDKYFGSK
jgi:hypothetical protein